MKLKEYGSLQKHFNFLSRLLPDLFNGCSFFSNNNTTLIVTLHKNFGAYEILAVLALLVFNDYDFGRIWYFLVKIREDFFADDFGDEKTLGLITQLVGRIIGWMIRHLGYDSLNKLRHAITRESRHEVNIIE